MIQFRAHCLNILISIVSKEKSKISAQIHYYLTVNELTHLELNNSQVRFRPTNGNERESNQIALINVVSFVSDTIYEMGSAHYSIRGQPFGHEWVPVGVERFHPHVVSLLVRTLQPAVAALPFVQLGAQLPVRFAIYFDLTHSIHAIIFIEQGFQLCGRKKIHLIQKNCFVFRIMIGIKKSFKFILPHFKSDSEKELYHENSFEVLVCFLHEMRLA